MKVTLNPELFARNYFISLQTPGSDVAPKVFRVSQKSSVYLYYKISGITYETKIPYSDDWIVYYQNFANNLLDVESVDD